MKLCKKVLVSILVLFCSIMPAKAASFGMTSSTGTVTPNGTFTVNVGGNCIGRVNLTVSNGTLSTNSVWVEEGYVSVRVTAGTSGKVVVTATPTEGFSDSDANPFNPGMRSVSVNIVSNTPSQPNIPTTPNPPSTSKPNVPSNTKPSTSKPNTSTQKPDQQPQQSSDNNLSSLTVSSGELSPKFDPNVTEYNLKLKADTEVLKMEASPSDEKAKIEGTGEIKVKPGNNNLTITVTAENGTKKTYTIKAYVDETPQVYLKYKNKKIGIIRNQDGIPLPDGFTPQEYKMNDHTILIFSKDKIYMIYGLNESNEKGFYVFDKEKNELKSKLIPLKINNQNFYITDAEIKKENLFLDHITIDKTKIDCYKFKNDSENYCLLTVLKENGKLKKYLYESTEKTIQLYHEFNSCPEPKKDNNNMIIYVLSGLWVMTIGTMIWFITKKKGGFHVKKK